VSPRPSFAAAVARADLFITTGLDLELWVPALLERANNPRVVAGAPGSVAAFSGVTLLQIPASVSRSEGDVHVFGNPHIYTDPINGILIGRNILAGLGRVDPDDLDYYRTNEERFEERIMRALFGDALVDMLGTEALFELARKGEFWEFARGQSFQGKPLTSYVGGWMAAAGPFRGKRIACYHKNWAYFTNRFDVECAAYIEPKVGIPPSPGHVNDVIELMRREKIRALLAANYFSRSQVERVAGRTDATAVIVPFNVGGAEGVDDYFALIDYWVRSLAEAFEGNPGDRSHP
jgi:zinc/manganese transport system substrate-binding protein